MNIQDYYGVVAVVAISLSIVTLVSSLAVSLKLPQTRSMTDELLLFIFNVFFMPIIGLCHLVYKRERHKGTPWFAIISAFSWSVCLVWPLFWWVLSGIEINIGWSK